MPIYEYACRACDHEFQKNLRMSQSSDPQSCPTCGSMDTRKRIGSIAVTGGASSTRAVSAPARPASSPFS